MRFLWLSILLVPICGLPIECAAQADPCAAARGLLANARADERNAEQTYYRAAELCPYLDEAHAKLAAIYEARGNYAFAYTRMWRASTLQPENTDYQVALKRLHDLLARESETKLNAPGVGTGRAQGGSGTKGIIIEPESVPTAPAQRIDLPVRFDFGSDELTQDAKAVLQIVGDVMVKGVTAGGRYLLRGHTDYIGSQQFNLDLSSRRAESVRAFMASTYAIELSSMCVEGVGKLEPVAGTLIYQSDAERAWNRRVQIQAVERCP